MMTIKLGLIALMISSSITYAPVDMSNIDKPVDPYKVQVAATSIPETFNIYNEEFNNAKFADEFIAKHEVQVEISETSAGVVSINQNKTYEECMREALERLYEEINRMLDKIAEEAGVRCMQGNDLQ